MSEVVSETINVTISDLKRDESELSVEVTNRWNDMMSAASVRALVRLDLEIALFKAAVGVGKSVKKWAKKLNEFEARIDALRELELTSSNYIKKILGPAKEIRIEFAAFKKGSVTNLLDEEVFEVIETKVEVELAKVA